MTSVVSIPGATVALSTASVYPESCAAAFATAARLGYDAVEVMVWTDPVSQEPGAVAALRELHGIPVVSVHAPTLLLTQRVWGTDPWDKVDRSSSWRTSVGAQHRRAAPAVPVAEGVRERLRRGGRAARARDRRRAGGREHVPVAGPAAGVRGLPAALGPASTSPTTTSPSTCRTPPPPGRTPWRWPQRPRAAAAPRPPRRRHRVRCATSTWCPGGAASRAPSSSSCWRGRSFDGSVVVEVEHPARRPPSSASWTSPRRWPSPGCTWPAPPWRSRMSPRGRRPGGVDTRAAIVEAARTRLRRPGVRRRRRVRGVARRAGVDPALVHHYFGGKAALFAAVMDIPADPAVLVGRVVEGPREEVGERLVRAFLDGLGHRRGPAAVLGPRSARPSPTRRRRGCCASSSPARSSAGWSTRWPARAGRASRGEALELRAGLAASQMVGLALMRYIVRFPAVVERLARRPRRPARADAAALPRPADLTRLAPASVHRGPCHCAGSTSARSGDAGRCTALLCVTTVPAYISSHDEKRCGGRRPRRGARRPHRAARPAARPCRRARSSACWARAAAASPRSSAPSSASRSWPAARSRCSASRPARRGAAPPRRLRHPGAERVRRPVGPGQRALLREHPRRPRVGRRRGDRRRSTSPTTPTPSSTGSPAASAPASPSPPPWSGTPSCSCSTSRPWASTPCCAATCGTCSTALRRRDVRCSSRATSWTRRAGATGWSSCARAGVLADDTPGRAAAPARATRDAESAFLALIDAAQEVAP